MSKTNLDTDKSIETVENTDEMTDNKIFYLCFTISEL